MSSYAAVGNQTGSAALQNQPRISNRLIIKFKSTPSQNKLSSAQVAADQMRPFTAQTLSNIQSAAGVALTESHAVSGGAHILILQGAPDRQSLDQAMEKIRGLSDVEYVEEDRIMTNQLIPNDTNYALQWGMKPVIPVAAPVPSGSGNYGADFETAWDTNSGTGVVIAIVDTGYTSHTEFAGQLISPGYTFVSDCRIRGTTAISGCAATTLDAAATVAPTADGIDTGDFISAQDIIDNSKLFPGPNLSNSSWHGTHVAGIAAATGNANEVIGGAYSARILPVRVLGKGGGHTSDIAEGIRWAANVHPTITNPNPARVINLSLGGSGACSRTEQLAIDAAVANGAVVVVAAGNSNADAANYSPVSCKNVISVASIGKDGLRAPYSNISSPFNNRFNPIKITLAAQGGNKALTGFDLGIYSSVDSGTTTPVGSAYAYYQGTSMATPHVAAAAALILSRNPALTPAEVKTILSLSVTPFPSSIPYYGTYDCAAEQNCGSGVLNAQYAVRNSVLPYSVATAVTASRGGGVSGGGCAIMSMEGNTDFSLLLSALIIIGYRYRKRINPTLGKN